MTTRRIIHLYIILIALILSACNLSQAGTPPADSPAAPPSSVTTNGLIIAWVERGNLMVWRDGDDEARQLVSGAVVRPFIAPDGAHIAFTRGPQSLPDTLWVVDIDGVAERQLVGQGAVHGDIGNRLFIAQVAWQDESVLLFNTVRQDDFSAVLRDDLYRAEIHTREVSLLLSPGEGGRFTISPDGEYVAVVYPGTYGNQDGRIRVIDMLSQERDNLLFFVGAATGAEAKFYPAVHWSADSESFRVAIPDKDLVYNDVAAPPTTLWRFTVDGQRERLGAAPASFFGQPQWPPSGDALVYVQRTGNAASNQFDLVVADDNGENAQVYASGSVGALQAPQWLPSAEGFIYAQGEPGMLWFGTPDAAPRRLPNANERAFNPVFAGDDRYVFATAPTGIYELRLASLNDIDATSRRIATVDHPFPVFDAVVVEMSNGNE
ncbi:MAG: hypothetical protein D6737_13665 [Chloroflexi bacterium]|nr:MAG: hypothetical protein D6737_13665 [Chloroflexota bacterium]